jgi:hypothetical protein
LRAGVKTPSFTNATTVVQHCWQPQPNCQPLRRGGLFLPRGLQRAREQGVFGDRLRRVLGIDAAAAEEEQLLHAEAVRALDEVILDREVVEQKVHGLGLVREDAADLRGRDDHVGGSGLVEVSGDRRAVEQVELGVGAQDQ